ncbi:N-acetyl-gamma-glutamyl-phosphate reductase [Egicoccus halophilus]|uniref:N-acetyl-gamma-glutamyl-phosphate reductase n=1 Tax=Egicoccus halophilus TaxID=1670830 RepID=A0A8J3A900_9ACTN|nr:N-acetyl-gamma-glutamyl-phosphate reductase [Egicoccus halophilus]GGI07496.1 N-acetyl-gamma-glutamyl-phosphate reductase [Egicoccus halophilus]
MTASIGIVGASGYGGVELLRLLAGHPSAEVVVVAAHSQAGQPVSTLFPNLPGDRVFDAVDLDRLSSLDLVLLSTPHGASLELGAALHDAGTRTVDLSGAFRLDAEAFATWYGEAHPRPDLAPAVYGLPERNRAAVAGATLVANPGCYVTTVLLGLLPLAPLLVPGSVVVDGKSGTSGAGRAAKDALHATHVANSLTAYGAPGHRHTGEIEAQLAAAGSDLGPVSFTPHLLPIARGLLTTSYAGLREDVAADDVQQALREAYADEPFVHVLEPGRFPVVKAVVGSNACQLSAVVDPRTGRVTVVAVTDNLGKGAAGQAVQNANLLLGFEETTGLSAIGMYP